MPKSAPYEFPDKFDALSKAGALILCDAIHTYWANRGYHVRAERFEVRDGAWGVRSDLVAGMPRAGRPVHATSRIAQAQP